MTSMRRRRSSGDSGFQREQGSLDEYRMLSDGLGGFIHLNRAVQGGLRPGAIHSAFTSTVKMSTARLAPSMERR
jgi:hypothetical protein